MKDLKHISKFLSLVLRHKPQEIGITPDANGWVDVDELIEKCNLKKRHLDFETLEEVVAGNDKQRFSFNEDLTRIRANQGHSIEIDLDYEAVEPPGFLYHGTVDKFLGNIRAEGLKKMNRHHVHLSKDLETAVKVGSRRGKPVILTVDAVRMNQDGYSFYRSKNGVWLCDQVPVEYIQF
ncbi:RNA 2'-phosphotransferase [Fluviicola sp.]|uniref:RNA 2'-phosphotransferase n=1 Tax=Fluviicola sp. TaxID=1917219 RepID=UPI0031D0E1F1